MKLLPNSIKNFFLIVISIYFHTQVIFADGNLSVNNYFIVNESILEFDVSINSTGSDFELSSYQCAVSFNNEILNDGSLTFSYINGSSDISNKPLTNCIMQENEIDRFLCFASNFGTDTVSTTVKKIGRFRLENSVPFGEYFCELNWIIMQNPRTIITGSQVSDITNQFTFSGLDFIVPVELVSFKAIASGSSVKLEWFTATELNNFGFEIQRKQTKLNSEFKKIKFIDGSGTNSISNAYEFIDYVVEHNNYYVYRLKQIDYDGTFEYSPEINIHFLQDLIYTLNQNYPNPFNPRTTINYQISESGLVIIKVYDLLGEEISTIVSEEKTAGEYNVEFAGDKLSSGIYLYQIQAGNFVETKKMTLLK